MVPKKTELNNLTILNESKKKQKQIKQCLYDLIKTKEKKEKNIKKEKNKIVGIIKKNGHEYIGDYLNGIIHGNGLYKWNKDQYYKGQYINGVKEGNGEMKYADGKKFICPFKNGKPDGIGIFIDPKGKEKEVQFIDGKINKDYKGSKNDN